MNLGLSFNSKNKLTDNVIKIGHFINCLTPILNFLEIYDKKFEHIIIVDDLNLYKSYKNKYKNVEVVYIKKSILYMFQLLKFLKNKKIKIIHIQFFYFIFSIGNSNIKKMITSSIQTIGILFLSKLYGIKTIINLHQIIDDITKESSLQEFKNKKHLNNIVRIFNRIVFCNTNAVIVFTENQSNLVKKYCKKINLSVIPFGVEKINPVKEKHEYFTFLYFGYIRKNKGVLDLLNAFEILSQKYKNIKLIIIGGKNKFDAYDPEEYYLNVVKKTKELSRKYNIEYYFEYVEDSFILNTINKVDVIVLPYIDLNNEISAVVTNFMDAGIPFVCTETPRFTSMLTRDEAIFYPPGNVLKLSEAMEKLYLNEDLRNFISRNLKNKAINLYWENIAKLYYNLYEKLYRKI